MKITAIFIALATSTILACGSDDKAIAEGNIEALCKKAKDKGEGVDYAECSKKMTALKESNQKLFMEVAKCASEAKDKDDMKYCDDQENPRYKGLMK